MYLPLRPHFVLPRRTESASRVALILSPGGFGSTERSCTQESSTDLVHERWCGKLRGKTELIHLPTARPSGYAAVDRAAPSRSDRNSFVGVQNRDAPQSRQTETIANTRTPGLIE